MTLAERARRVMPGGVSSPVRALGAVNDTPLFIDRANGARVVDDAGRTFIDYIGSWGAGIVGHAHPAVIEAVQRTARDGLGFGATSRLEIALAEEIVSRVPNVEQVRFVCSGTEAVMSAIRLARAVTGRTTIVKFAGGYHGHADAVLVSAGSGVATHALGDSPGVPASVARETLQLEYNDADGVRELFAREGHRIACVVVEPVAGNMGVVPAREEFLRALRECTREHGALLLFDEVMTGFRVSRGGAQELTGVSADIVTVGKVIGGGLPVAAYAAPRAIMRHVAPEGAVYQAGTLAGNPLGMAAGLATLGLLDSPAYDRLDRVSHALQLGLETELQRAGTRACVQRVGSMMTLFLGVPSVSNYREAQQTDQRAFGELFRGMRRASVLLPPSPYEAWFVSLAHGPQEIESTLDAVRRTLGSLPAHREESENVVTHR